LTKTYIFSWGGGVNSTAILAMIKLGMLPELTKDNTHIVFADTGAEMPYTYEHTSNCLQPMARDGWKVKVLSRSLTPEYYTPQTKQYDLCEYVFHNKWMPSRMFRVCTDKWKIQPLKKYKKSLGDNVVTILGIATEERQRAKELGSEHTIYPLIDHNIDRDDCITLIDNAGLPMARKSGCWFCPFTRQEGWIDLYRNFPDLFKKVEEIEGFSVDRHTRLYFVGNKPIRENIEHWIAIKKDECKQGDLFDTNRHCLCEL